MFGSHLSIAGGLHNALIEARSLGMDCVQVFTKNQRQWSCPPLTDQQITTWQQHQRDTKIKHVVSHDSYLINLASPDKVNLKKSTDLFRNEIERCEALTIPHLVIHPGAHMKTGEAVGLAAVARSLDKVHKQLPGYKTITCLEITAGQGTTLGYTFEHLARIIELVSQPDRMAVCLDTAHLLAAGYDLTSTKGARAVLSECDNVIGLDRVKVLHLNDSKVPRGKRVDRHDHIGHGHVSLDAFKIICRSPKFKSVPKILETPKATSPDGRPYDLINLETLRNLTKRKTPKK